MNARVRVTIVVPVLNASILKDLFFVPVSMDILQMEVFVKVLNFYLITSPSLLGSLRFSGIHCRYRNRNYCQNI